MTTTINESLTRRFAREALEAIHANGDDHRQAFIDRIKNLPHDLTAAAVDGLVCYSNAANPDSFEETALVLLVMNAIAELSESEQAELREIATDRLKWTDADELLRYRLWDMCRELTE